MTSTPNRRTVFVTVGSTAFDNLITTVLNPTTINQLEQLHYTHLRIQYGKGQTVFEQHVANHIKDAEYINITSQDDNNSTTSALDIEGFAYTSMQEFAEEIEKADLVISHAGAGSILDALSAQKRLIVVPNETLMDNHQVELADKMVENKHVLKGDIGNLAPAIQAAHTMNFEPLPRHGGQAFAKVVMEELSKIA